MARPFTTSEYKEIQAAARKCSLASPDLKDLTDAIASKIDEIRGRKSTAPRQELRMVADGEAVRWGDVVRDLNGSLLNIHHSRIGRPVSAGGMPVLRKCLVISDVDSIPEERRLAESDFLLWCIGNGVSEKDQTKIKPVWMSALGLENSSLCRNPG